MACSKLSVSERVCFGRCQSIFASKRERVEGKGSHSSCHSENTRHLGRSSDPTPFRIVLAEHCTRSPHSWTGFVNPADQSQVLIPHKMCQPAARLEFLKSGRWPMLTQVSSLITGPGNTIPDYATGEVKKSSAIRLDTHDLIKGPVLWKSTITNPMPNEQHQRIIQRHH